MSKKGKLPPINMSDGEATELLQHIADSRGKRVTLGGGVSDGFEMGSLSNPIPVTDEEIDEFIHDLALAIRIHDGSGFVRDWISLKFYNYVPRTE